MVRPSPAHSARLRLTTKQVNGGYYKGNRSGSMGAHTEWGGYIIDYRKARNFNCPDLSNNRLTPFVTAQIRPPKWKNTVPDGQAFVEAWKMENREEYLEKKEQWRAYLEGTYSASTNEDRNAEASRMDELNATAETAPMEKSSPITDTRQVEDDVYVQAREDAMAQSQDPGKSKTWLGRVFKK